MGRRGGARRSARPAWLGPPGLAGAPVDRLQPSWPLPVSRVSPSASRHPHGPSGRLVRAMNPVRVGVWGVGVWGEKHARVYDALPDVALVGVYDRDPERARTVAERYRCSVFPSPEAMLDQCEAVSIAVATVAHRAALERSAAAGRHALVEKPMAP